MKALSVRQPWAGAILDLGKSVENRRQAWAHRGQLLIHSSQRTADGRAFAEVAEISGRPVPVLGTPSAGTAWAVGAIVGVVDLVGVHTSTACETAAGLCSPWAEHGAIHLQLEQPRKFARPVPCNGRLGLWVPDEFTARHVRAQIGAPGRPC